MSRHVLYQILSVSYYDQDISLEQIQLCVVMLLLSFQLLLLSPVIHINRA